MRGAVIQELGEGNDIAFIPVSIADQALSDVAKHCGMTMVAYCQALESTGDEILEYFEIVPPDPED